MSAPPITKNQQAFLDMVAYSEGTSRVPNSDDGYRVLVGGSVFASLDDHPCIVVKVRAGLYSTAAGRYQLLMRYYYAYKRQLGLKDFSPASQDAIALQQIRECKALDDIEQGRLASAVAKCAHIWASLPGAGYGQHENTLARLQLAYTKAGGSLA